MMERRQIWLEDQFRRQERDLLKLSRQVYILQDFITLHFDSFRDYSIERGRADRPVHESSFKNIPFLRPPSPYSPYPERRRSINSDLSERDLDDPIDLSESDQGPPSPATAVDLSASSRTEWASHRCSRGSQNQSPSPSLSCSLSKDLVAENYKFEQLSPVSTEDVPPTESLSIFPNSSSSCANNNNINLSPRLPLSTDSVLSRILRSDPATKATINYETISNTGNLAHGSRKDTSGEYNPHLHWSSGTVTTSTTATPSLYDGRDKISDNTENDSGAFKDNHPVEDYQSDYYNYISSGEINSYAVDVNREKNPSISKPRGRNGKHSKRVTARNSRGHQSASKKNRGSNSSRTDAVTTPSPSETSREGQQTNRPEGHRSKKCRFCGKTFQWSHSVKTHERLHTGDKPYLCKMCGTRFTQNGNLKVHAKTCVGKYAEMYKSKNILVCPLCTEMFQSVDALMEHQRSHDRMQWTDKDKTCRYCGQVFQKRSILLTHEMSHIQGDEFHSRSSETGDNNVGSPGETTDD